MTRGGRGLSLISAALALGLSFACQSREVVPLDLAPPDGAVSGILGLERPTSFDAYAFDVSDPPRLPSIEGFDEVASVDLTVRYYDQSLAALGLVAGRVPPRVEEPEFGPIPRSQAFPEDRRMSIEAGALPDDWSLGDATPRFGEFVSPLFPFDREACFDLAVEQTFQPGAQPSPTRVAAIRADLAIVTFGAGRSEQLFTVRRAEDGWRSELIPSDHALRRMADETGTISFLQGDGQGGYYVGECTGPGGSKTSTVWRAPSFEGEPVAFFTETAAPQCPAAVLEVDEGAWLVQRHGGTLVWLERLGGGIDREEVKVPEPIDNLVLHGSTVLGARLDHQDDPSRQVHLFQSKQHVGTEALPVETNEGVRALAVAGTEAAALVHRRAGGLGNKFYLRSSSGGWRYWDLVSAQYGSRMLPFYGSVVFAVTFGQILQLTRRDGLCPEQAAAITGVYDATHFVALDERTFLVAGYSSSSNSSAPSRVAVVRARPRAP